MDAHEHMQRALAELLTLSCINEEASFSYYISKLINARTEGAIHIQASCIIPHLYHLLENGQIKETQREINGRIRTCYAITPAGRERLADLTQAYMDTHQAFLVFLEKQKQAQ